MQDLDKSPLGKASSYIDQYEPTLLFPIPRAAKRAEIGADRPNVFFGEDIWNAYEISCLNEQGKPLVAVGEFRVPASSPRLVESKSLKLYLNSFNNSRFTDLDALAKIIAADLSQAAGASVYVTLIAVHAYRPVFDVFAGTLLDELELDCRDFTVDPSLLLSSSEWSEETLVSHIVKSNCLVTGQPDWASLRIVYRGNKIEHAGLLRYLVSFRNHNEFHEQCVERIFVDLMRYCQPEFLTLEARYTRRGGIDINPCRSSHPTERFANPRLNRQ